MKKLSLMVNTINSYVQPAIFIILMFTSILLFTQTRFALAKYQFRGRCICFGNLTVSFRLLEPNDKNTKRDETRSCCSVEIK